MTIWNKLSAIPRATAVAGAAASCLLFSACASTEAPAKDLADSEAAVRAATELGANGTPQAALHLQLAKERLDKAKSLNAKGEGDSAKAMLDEAKADAELAVVLTRQEQAERDAQQAQHQLNGAIQQENQPAKAE